MNAKNNYDVKRKCDSVPPDGGWSYAIAVAVIINISVATIFASSYGTLFKEFLRENGLTSSKASLIRGISAICTAIGGYLTSPLLSIMSVRMLTLAATLTFYAGVIIIIFVKSVFTFSICYGVLQGLGAGFIYNLSWTILNDYFVKRRLMVISIVQSVVAVISMVAPLFLKWSLEKYGFHHTILLLSGIAMHNFIAVALMRPVKCHAKTVEDADSSDKFLQDKKTHEECIVPIVKLTNAEDNLSNPNEKNYFATNEETNRINFRRIISLLVDKSLCQTFLMSCVCAGPALALFADTIYAGILPHAFYITGWEKDNIALAVSLYGFGDLAMRVLCALLSNWLRKLGTQEIYVLGVTLGLVSRLGMLWSKSFIALMIYITLVGASHCAVSTLVPLVVADAVDPGQFTAALGILMMLTGLLSLVLGPAIGAVKELSNSYGPCFYLIASCFAMIVLFWSIELCYKKNKHKRLQRKEYLRQKKLNK